MTVLLFGIAAFTSTLLGGWFTLCFTDKLHLILGFSAGAVISSAFFDLLPEAIELASKEHDATFVSSLAALGFMLYIVWDRAMVLRTGGDEEIGWDRPHGRLGAGSLSIHSFLDGLAMSLAFQVSAVAGLVLAMALLVHDFSGGINTVNMALKNSVAPGEAQRCLCSTQSRRYWGYHSLFSLR